MNTPLNPERLTELIDGRLDAAQRREVEAHLEQHPEQAQLYRDLVANRNRLREAPSLSSGKNMAAAVMGRVQRLTTTERQSSAAVEGPHSWKMISVLTALAASLLLACFLMWRMGQNQRYVVDATSVTAESKAPATNPAAPSQAPMDEIDRFAGGGMPGGGGGREASDAVRSVAPGKVTMEKADLAGRLGDNQGSAQAGVSGGQVQQSALEVAPATQPGDIRAKSGELAEQLRFDSVRDFAKSRGDDRSDAPVQLSEMDAEPPKEMAQVESANSIVARPPDAPAEAALSFDRLILVQLPAQEPGRKWIESVFENAHVQLQDPTDTFAERLADRKQKLETQSRSLANAKDADAPPSSAGKGNVVDQAASPVPSTGNQVVDSRLRAESAGQRFGAPAPDSGIEYVAGSDGYYVEATVPQLKAIIRQMNGAALLSFQQTPQWQMANGAGEDSNKFYQVSPAIARRLPPALAIEEQRRQNASSTPNREDQDDAGLIAALGLPTNESQRLRVLFVIQSQPQSTASAVPEPKPAEAVAAPDPGKN